MLTTMSVVMTVGHARHRTAFMSNSGSGTRDQLSRPKTMTENRWCETEEQIGNFVGYFLSNEAT